MLCGIATANAQESVYNDDLYVTVDGETTGPYASTVLVTNNTDGTINFGLNNFILLTEDGDEMPVGNISVPNLLATVNAGVTSFTFDGILTIQEGSDETIDFWLGPDLGELPTKLSGKLDNEHLYVVIDIATEMLGTIHVEFGKEDNVTAISAVKANQDKYVGAFDLVGRKVSGNFKGIRIVNGKKVVR